MTTDDMAAVAGMMARAFFDDPLQSWIHPNAQTRLDVLARVFGAEMQSAVPEHWYTDAGCRTAAFWNRPGDAFEPVTEASDTTALEAMVGGAWPRLRATMNALAAAHPSEPHWYLEGIGTDPVFQGQGLGAAVLAPMLAICDRDQVPAYLESTNRRNEPFYERLGFTAFGTIRVGDDGPTLVRMWRQSRA
jgi:GNAT superfamily N-acetyltransferase